MMIAKENKTGQFDLIKIIAIFMILILHYFNGHMGNGMDDSISFNGIVSHSLESICIIACNLFVLITSWFMVDKKEIKYKKIFDLIILTVFYGVTIYVINILSGAVLLSKQSFAFLISTIFARWFLIIYIIFYLLIPFLNKMLKGLSKKNIIALLIIMTFFFSFWPTVINNITVGDGGYGIITFIYLYIIVYFIKKYTDYNNYNGIYLFIIWMICIISTIFYSYVAPVAWNYNSFMVIGASVSMFLLLSKIKINRNKVLTYLSSFAFSTYIIHENVFVSKWIYKDIFRSSYYSKTVFLIPNLLISIICIFIICSIIEILRRLLFKYTIDILLFKSKIYNNKLIVNW